MTVKNLTEDFVSKLKVPEGKPDELLWDAKAPGFFVRKFAASGKVIYGVKCTLKGEKTPKKHKLVG